MTAARSAMRHAATAVTSAAVVAVAGSVPVARATFEDIAINATMRAVSDGQWAKTNEIFHDEPTVSSIWTITSSCSGAYDCVGQVTSDHGWTAQARYISNLWLVTRTLPDWVRCDDGSTASGKQIFKFYRDPNDPAMFRGWDSTVGPSGACGINLPLAIEMPFTLSPV